MQEKFKGSNTHGDKRDVEIRKNSNKIGAALIISIFALLISIIQVIINSPFFINEYNKPKLVVEEGENIITGTPIVASSFYIKNTSNKTANNLVVAIDVYDLNTIRFYPENAFKLSDSIPGEYFFKKRYFFTKNNLIPDERILVTIFNRIDTIAKKVGADTLIPNFAYNCQDFVPHIAELKSDLGFAKIFRSDKYIIMKYNFKVIGHYKLIGNPISK